MTPMFTTKVNVLLVDDDTIYQFVASKTLQSTGYISSIRVCSNGKEAYNFLEQNLDNHAELPDVILLDLNMPVMNGWQFLEAYQELRSRISKEIHLFIVTSSPHEQDKKISTRFDCIENYIIKPLVRDKVSELLAGLVAA